MKKKIIKIIGVVLAILLVATAIYLHDYYKADDTALKAFESDEKVTVSQESYGWFFDGSGKDDLIIFYPGGKVEEKAYGPLVRLMAESGFDVCLLEMPGRLAILAVNKALKLSDIYSGYSRCFLAGHSLGGASAAMCADKHPDEFAGLILLGAYPTKETSLKTLFIYGDSDLVVNRDKLRAGMDMCSNFAVKVIKGGNHCQFGSYGFQKGDGTASISPEQQWIQACQFIADQLGKD